MSYCQLVHGRCLTILQTFQSLLPPAPYAPNPPPPSAHLYLAQLSDEDPHLALKHYEAAVGILHGQLKGKERAVRDDAVESELDIRKNIVRVLVAMVEIWMAPTYDLWYVLDIFSILPILTVPTASTLKPKKPAKHC